MNSVWSFGPSYLRKCWLLVLLVICAQLSSICSVSSFSKNQGPETGPIVMSTSYHVEGPCQNRRRNVVIYWNHQAQSSITGRLTGYEVHAHNEVTKVLPSLTSFRTTIACDAATDFELFTLTTVGPSLNASVVQVPGVGEQDFPELSQFADIKFKVEERPGEDGTMKELVVTWSPDDLDRSRNTVTLVFYVCQEGEPNTCINGFTTQKVAFIQGNLLLNNVDLSHNLFGYALTNEKDRKTGIDWTNCVYRRDRAPGTPTGLEAFPGQEPGSVHVVWSSSRCDRCRKVLVTHYSLQICAANMAHYQDHQPNPQTCLDVKIESSMNGHHKFENLEAGRDYIVYLKAESPGGLSPMVATSTKASQAQMGEDRGLDTNAQFDMDIQLQGNIDIEEETYPLNLQSDS